MKKKTVKAWAVYSDLGESILQKVFAEDKQDEAVDYWITHAKSNKMPYESETEVYERYKVIPCTITYSLPITNKKK